MSYDDDFFDRVDAAAATAAAVVVPVVHTWFEPRSVIDVGCGRGAWLAEFARSGVDTVLGCDGTAHREDRLHIAAADFRQVDLEHPAIEGRFDLALCLEVAEHLGPAAADGLVAALVDLAPVIVFSAAIPGQGGSDHRNEQWPGYWQERFATHGLSRFDVLRNEIQHRREVAWWFRQNIAVYASPEAIDRFAVLDPAAAVPADPDLEVIRVALADRHLRPTVRRAARDLAGAVRRSIAHRRGP